MSSGTPQSRQGRPDDSRQYNPRSAHLDRGSGESGLAVGNSPRSLMASFMSGDDSAVPSPAKTVSGGADQPHYDIHYLCIESQGKLVTSWLWEHERLESRFGSRSGLDAKVIQLLCESSSDSAGYVLARVVPVLEEQQAKA